MSGGLFGTDPWFEPKRFGYGSGWPCAWQGWVLLGAYVAAATMLAVFAEEIGWITFALGLAAISIPFVWLAHRHTRGGWKWRG